MTDILKELVTNLNLTDLGIKQQIIDGIMAVENEDVLIGLDISDVLDLFKDYTELHIGIVNSKTSAEADETIDALIASTQANISDCNKVYLYIKGDITLMDVNEVALALEKRLGEAVEIVFTATYDETRVEEYDVMAVFIK